MKEVYRPNRIIYLKVLLKHSKNAVHRVFETKIASSGHVKNVDWPQTAISGVFGVSGSPTVGMAQKTPGRGNLEGGFFEGVQKSGGQR